MKENKNKNKNKKKHYPKSPALVLLFPFLLFSLLSFSLFFFPLFLFIFILFLLLRSERDRKKAKNRQKQLKTRKDEQHAIYKKRVRRVVQRPPQTGVYHKMPFQILERLFLQSGRVVDHKVKGGR